MKEGKESAPACGFPSVQSHMGQVGMKRFYAICRRSPVTTPSCAESLAKFRKALHRAGFPCVVNEKSRTALPCVVKEKSWKALPL